MKWTTEITNKGAELIAQAVASGDMVFTKAVGSSTLSGAADLKTVTEVSQPQYELKLKSIEAVGNSTRLTVRLLNDGVDEAYTIRQVGIYGKLKDDSEETLISISENSVGETVPSTTTIPEWVCDLAIVLNMDNTIKPTINIPSGVYALKTDIPTTLPANGGNADTLDGLHANEIASNPNLLINPDFKINQRGESAYSGVGYTADMWKLQFPNSSASIEEGGYKLGLTASSGDTSIASVMQTIEEPERFCGKMVTLTVDYKTVVSNRVYIEVATTDHSDASHLVAGKFITEGAGKYSVTGIIPDDVKTMFVRIYGADRRVGDDIDAYSIINYAKLELGSIATPFVSPDPATELLRIQSMNDDGTPKLISNNTLPTIMNSQMVSNPNLLDNPDFRINQRGFVSGSVGTGSISVDRWFLGAGEELTINDDGSVTIKCVSDNGRNFQQTISIPAYLIGKTVTLSVGIVDASGRINFGYTDDSGMHTDYINATGIASKSFEIASTSLTINLVPADVDSYITISYIKLEPGSIVTPFVPPNPTEELLKIQSMNDDGTPKLVSNDALPTIMNSQMVSNPNLLINPDFRINQRGETAWSIGTTHTYFVDRWYSARSELSLSDDGIMFAWNGKDDKNGWIQQIVNSPSYFGKTVTISLNANDTIYNVTSEIPASVNTSTIKSVKGASLGVGVTNHAGKYFSVVLFSVSTEPVIIKWLKCELGSIATPFVPPDPATELAKCQRYYASHFIVKDGFYGTAYADRANCARLTVALPATIRNLPTIVYTADNLALFDGVNTINFTTLEVHTMMGNEITLSVIAEGGLTVGKSYLLLATNNTTIAYSAEL